MRVEFFRRPRWPDAILLMVTLFAAAFCVARALAETPVAAGPHTTTMIVFAERSMPEGEWTALMDSLRRSAASAAQETPELRGGFEVLRGEMIPRGLRVDVPISIYLHGDCRLVPHPFTIAQGTLGWVMRVNGRIEPFVHVECTRLVEMLSPMALSMTQNRRNTVMAEAIARVILHEWIHIATQNEKHASRGVEKSEFGVMDLLAEDAQWRAAHERKKKRG
jgi:hypothetical protein